MKLLGCFALIAGIPAWSQVSPTINDLPSREFGHAKLTNPVTTGAPNLVEGRELSAPLSVAFAPGGGPLYVADTNNNRVLAWLNPAGLTKGNPADKVIGQRDFYSTFAQGPGGDLFSGLAAPTSVAVDGNGNLFVLDAGNNRVVRYPNPFNQSGDLQLDLVIGQKTQSSGRLPNEGNATPSSKTLSFNAGGGLLRGAIALDAQGNLWVTDAGNNRVLRFPTNQLSAGTVEPVADRKLGQPNFTSNTITCNSNCQINGTILLQPQSLAFDSNGTLYVADGYARVVSYSDPQSEGPATRFLGLVPAPAAGQQPKPYPNDYSLGNSTANAQLAVFTNGNAVFVADTLASRVVFYTTPGGYIPSDTAPSPKIDGVVGQPDLFSGESNRVKFHEPDATSLSFPGGGAFDPVTKNLWVADSGNNRVLSYAASGAFTSANVVVGQTDFQFNSPNLIEGREIWLVASVNGQPFPGGGIAVDKSSNPPHLYIADTFNNRILGFNDARAVGTDARSLLTQKADLVIGQPDLSRAIVNYPGGDPDLPTQTGLLRPVGLVVDDSGNLWVADSGNGRVLRFPPPFGVPAGAPQSAELVLGQSDFRQKDQSISRQRMSAPLGVALFPSGDLAVSDPAFNRVLVFKKPFTDKNAFSVIGQQDYNSKGASSTAAGLNSPRQVATDTSGRLYVADSGNNRVSVYSDTSATSQTGPTDLVSSNTFFNLNAPQGIAVSAFSGEMWVSSGLTVYHLDEFSRYQQTGKVLQSIGSNSPTAVALDPSDNLIVAEAINRIAFFFAKLVVKNAFTFTSTRPLTPGMWVQAYAPTGKSFADTDQSHDPPYPTTMAGLELRVNGVPSAIYAIGKTYINFNVPWSAPTSGTAEFLMINPVTREILAAGTLPMASADPAFKTVNGLGTGQILAANFTTQGVSNGLNSPTNPVALGDILQLALTGQGLVDNPPADGFPPSGQVKANPDLKVIINGKDWSDHILFSGLDPTYPGSWIINVRIPTVAEGGPVPGTNNVPIFVYMHDIASTYGYDPTNFNNDIQLMVSNGRITTFAVK